MKNIFGFMVFCHVIFNTVHSVNISIDNISFYDDKNQLKISSYLTQIRQKTLIFTVQEIITEYVKDLIVLKQYKNLTMLTEDLEKLLHTVDEGYFSINEWLVFRNELVELGNKYNCIKSETHMKTHIIHDMKSIFGYLNSELHIFQSDLRRITDRFDFECKMRSLENYIGETYEMTSIFYYWFQLLFFFPDKELNEQTLRAAIFNRLVLERPHWLSYFSIHNSSNLDLTMYYYF